MTVSPGVRKLVLTAHVASSVGWLGAVAGFLAIAIVGFTGQDARVVRGAYLVMEPVAWLVLVPLAVASLLTGLALSLGTRWGLFRHYWVLITLLIDVLATVVLALYTQTLGYLAGLAADPDTDLGALQSPSPVLHASAALMLLVVATALSVYKPRGMTLYGRRKQGERQRRQFPEKPDLGHAEER